MDEIEHESAAARERRIGAYNEWKPQVDAKQADHERRIYALEKRQSWLMGAGAALGAASMWLLRIFGVNGPPPSH